MWSKNKRPPFFFFVGKNGTIGTVRTDTIVACFSICQYSHSFLRHYWLLYEFVHINVIMTRSLSIVVLLGLAMLAVVQAFVHPPATSFRTSTTSLNVLDNDTICKLEEMRTKYMNMADDAPEKASLKDTVEKYTTYRETKAMMGRLRQMWRTEASERRRARQLKSFTELYDARLDVEAILKERLGAKAAKSDEMKAMLDAIAKCDKQIAELETKYEKVKIVIPEGMSTRKERYGVGAEQRGITY